MSLVVQKRIVPVSSRVFIAVSITSRFVAKCESDLSLIRILCSWLAYLGQSFPPRITANV